MPKLYLGSREFQPDGYLTVDIDPAHKPDVVADVTNLAFGDNTVAEICASHILEHIPWPLSFATVAEWARVLKHDGCLRLAVPDARLLAKLIVESRNPYFAMGLLFGVGRLETPLEAHQYGYTTEMLTTMLAVLGFGEFDWWTHDLPDGSNGWMPVDGRTVAISINIEGKKLRPPLVEPQRIIDRLTECRMTDFVEVVREFCGPVDANSESELMQRLHWRLIETRGRVRYLEEHLEHQKKAAE